MIDPNFVYSKRDAIIVGVAAALVVVLMGVGFGMASAKSVDVVAAGVGEKTAPKSNFELALDILDKHPIIDG